MMVTGVGLDLQNVEFIDNTAIQDMRAISSGHGGGIAAIYGASISISNSRIRGNIADVSGGGLFVMDSSVAVFASNFTRNRAIKENGNGGAVALMLTSNRMIPTLEGESQRRFESRHPLRPVFLGATIAISTEIERLFMEEPFTITTQILMLITRKPGTVET